MSSPEMPHILVIDDDPFNHVLLAEGLGDEFELLFAKHWREVVEIVGHSPRLRRRPSTQRGCTLC